MKSESGTVARQAKELSDAMARIEAQIGASHLRNTRCKQHGLEDAEEKPASSYSYVI